MRPPGIGIACVVIGAMLPDGECPGTNPSCMRARATIGRMASISRDDVEHVAHLARLHLTDEELDRMQAQLSNILEAIDTLRDVDTSHVGPNRQRDPARERHARGRGAARDRPRRRAGQRAAAGGDPFLRVPTVLEEGR